MKTIGVGVILKTKAGTYLLQERDYNTRLHPGRIAPFGGALDSGEDAYEGARRELYEELALTLNKSRLEEIGPFSSYHKPETYIQMFLVKDIDKNILRLQEGKSIVEMSLEEALESENVTDFTKEVLRSL